MKGRLFPKLWHAEMNAGVNMQAASAKLPKLYSPKQPFSLIHQTYASLIFLLYGNRQVNWKDIYCFEAKLFHTCSCF